MAQLQFLLEFVSSPLGIISLFGAMFLCHLGVSERRARPVLIAILLVSASFCKNVTEWFEAPTFVFPLELFVTRGREITAAFLGLLLVSTLASPTTRHLVSQPHSSSIALLTIQIVIVTKMAVQGDFVFALLALVIYSLSFIFFHVALPRWLDHRRAITLIPGAIALSGPLFVAACLPQLASDSNAMFDQGRFFGLTGNSQHAAILLSISSFSLLAWGLSIHQRYGLFLITPLAILLIATTLMSGSRTGVGVFVLSAVVFFRRRSPTSIAILLGLLGIAIGTWLSLSPVEVSNSHLSSMDNTRHLVWNAMLQGFLQNPLFGAAIQGERMGFGENSWLALASNTGLAGVVPAAAFLFLVVQLAISLEKQAARAPGGSVAGWCSATIFGLLGGTLFEAYLCGIVAYPLFVMQLCIACGNSLRRL